MFGWQYLDMAIAVALLFCLVSVVCSGLFEAISAGIGLRGLFLRATIRRMLPDLLAKRFASHRSIRALQAGWNGFPSYIDPKLFGRICYAESVDNAADPRGLTSRVHELDPFFSQATSPSGVVSNLADWFNVCTDRTSGLYRRWSQLALFVVAMILCFVLSLDALEILQYFDVNSGQRDRLLASLPVTGDARQDIVTSTSREPFDIGAVLSAFAISLGSTIWFDVAKNLHLNPRQAGPSHGIEK